MSVMHNVVGRDALYRVWNASDQYMIIYFDSDGGGIVFSDAIYPIERGAICFVAAGNLHYTMPEDPQKYVRSKIFISERSLRGILNAVPPESPFFRLFSKNSAVYAKLAETDREQVARIFSEAASRFCKDDREEGIVASFFYLMALISDSVADHIQTPSSFMARTIEYINAAYYEEISLDTLCRVVNMSKSHFCRKFKLAMGMTVMEYVFKTRIAAAQTLLLSSNLSISQISERCGFSGISYFCQKFKEETGLTASAFREHARSKGGSGDPAS